MKVACLLTAMGSSGGLDEHVADQIAALDESLARVDEVFGNLSGVDYQDITKNVTASISWPRD